MFCLQGVPGLPGAPQDEAGLHEEIRDEPSEQESGLGLSEGKA